MNKQILIKDVHCAGFSYWDQGWHSCHGKGPGAKDMKQKIFLKCSFMDTSTYGNIHWKMGYYNLDNWDCLDIAV